MAKILIIDDDTQLLKVVSAYLAKDGHDISTASDGRQGIKLLTADRFDLVITDIVMPEQDGLEVLQWLKAQTARPKVIAISGGSLKLSHDTLLKIAGFFADKVMTKPVDYATLTSAVHEVLGVD